ncbi:hypothetical protein TWF106_003765 [Orbilia oligospora]|uniref:Uncharacterized protein n=1 Tax=Orbilia oligospora TaxID=2813651 RepID=A0A6G1LUY4_ORBOL|nr:hypothetical protein TWF788_006309 [Orbilia oligospora]KAF3199529.1 hypothetical protein TWF106_003765 [Orbilia oligospora]KAF3200097.1 hypothetical protein TWF679_001084 [Orbilia oligospora]KAF3200783.1 hypothetical protein TWF191_003665 [Orbilia oligospora]KAF3235228.1 hypothetical protein TWF192_000814 [Orbilia oligospora]
MSRRLSARQQNNVRKTPVTAEPVSPDPDGNSPPTVNFIGVKQYFTEEQRLRSFTSPPTRKRQSNSKKGSKSTKWSWPAGHPAPELMARAGFYFKPTQGEEDNSACFLCQKNMSFWETEDDPAEQHGRHGTTCGWALTMCRDLVADGKIIAEPLGEEMCRARRMTFDQWWPHEDKKGWIPTVEKVVMAGFIFRPRGEGDDTVFCPYCSLSIDAWEKDDDPREAHKSLGSGTCLFLQHTANNSISTAEEKKESNLVGPTDAGEAKEEKPGPRRRISRARKAPTNQRKKTTPKNKLDDDHQHDTGSKVGDEDDIKESSKLVRGKKRGSAAMEEGGKKLLFSNEEDKVTKVVDGQRLLAESKEIQNPRSTKRRVTRASMANQPSASDPAARILDCAAGVDDNDAESSSCHNTLIKLKPREKKKATQLSTTGAKIGRAAKKVTSKTPLNVHRPSDEEIDGELEHKITEGFGVADGDNMKEADSLVTAPNVEDPGDSNELVESGITQDSSKNTTHRLTKTKPISRRPPSAVSGGLPKDQVHTQPKPRRKRLTRTKPQTSDSTDTQSVSEDVISLEEPDGIEHAAEIFPSPHDVSSDATSSGGVESHGTLSDYQVQPPTSEQGEVAPPNLEPGPMPKISGTALIVGSLSAEAAVEIPSAAKEAENLPQDSSQGPQKTVSAQIVQTRPSSISPTKDKDMKRKSDVVTDDGQDRRTSKKRKMVKTIKAAKPRVNPKKKENAALIDSETSPEIQKPDNPVLLLGVQPPHSSTPSTALEESAVQAEAPSNHEDSTVGDQGTILDDSGGSQAIGMGEVRSTIIPGSTSEDNTIDVILNGYARPHEPSPKKTARADVAPKSETDKTPPSPGISSDSESLDSIQNTQLSMPTSQMTVATSFQGSIKGVNFIEKAEEPLPTKQDASAVENVREQSVTMSPKQSRTPLSVLSKSRNGALALMTPRARAEDVSFAPVQSQKPWKSTDVELYIDGLKENQEKQLHARCLPVSERDMTVAEWITDVSKRAEKQLVRKGELLVRLFEDEAERAIAAIEAIETE